MLRVVSSTRADRALRRRRMRHARLIEAIQIPNNLLVTVKPTAAGRELLESYRESDQSLVKLVFPHLSDAEVEEIVANLGHTPASNGWVRLPLRQALRLLSASLDDQRTQIIVD